MLTKLWQEAKVQSVPMITEQPRWDLVDQKFKEQLISIAEEYLDFSWPTLPATMYMEFMRDGNRAHYESQYFKRRQVLAILVVAECLEGEGRFLDDIINGIWFVCEESTWVLPAHHNQFYCGERTNILPRVQESVIDLFAAETGVLLAWTRHLLRTPLDKFAKQVNERIIYELKARILDPYLKRNDFWWMGLNQTDHTLGNWVPWTTGNCLRCFLFVESDARRRRQAVDKALLSLDKYLAEYSLDGGCDEGPSYWGRSGGSLFECLEMLTNLTDKSFDPFKIGIIQQIGQYMYKVHIAGDYFVNFADGSAKAEVEGPILYSYGKKIFDQILSNLGAKMYQLNGLTGLLRPQTFSLGRLVRAAVLHRELVAASLETSVVKNHWLKHLQVMISRQSANSSEGFFLATKGGHNGENHNHNDVGSCLVFYDGQPVIIDVGVETYTAQTFSAQRYKIWTMRSEYHNLPIINGRGQSPGREYGVRRVLHSSDNFMSRVSMDISRAYPKSSGVKSWIRSYTLQRHPQSQITIADQYSLEYARSIQMVFMLAQKPKINGDTVELQADCKQIQLSYNGPQSSIICEQISILDARLKPVWGDVIYRLIFTVTDPKPQGELSFKLTL